MENFQFKSCVLCLTPIKGENYVAIKDDTKEILDVFLLNLDSDDNGKNLICYICLPQLYAALTFKSTCLDTDDAIFPYVDGATGLPIDLKGVYMKVGAIEHMSEDLRICRLCMKPIRNISELKSINDEQADMIGKFVPEMKIFTIKEPVMCKLCSNSLTEHCNFLKKCSYAERKVGNIYNKHVADDPSPVLSLHTSVKIEDVDIKSEYVQQSNQMECMDITHDGIKIESIQDRPSLDVSVKLEDVDMDFEDVKHSIETECLDIKDEETKTESEVHNQDISDSESCLKSSYKASEKPSFSKRKMENKEHKQMPIYKCENCNYATSHKGAFNRHRLIHTDPSQLEMYRCENCNFVTKYKESLIKHMLIHKDCSEVQMYKCENCSYATKYKGSLKSHMLVHKNPSQVQMYKCENCEYVTKYKNRHKSHMLIHKKH